MRVVTHRYLDPLDHLWLVTARRVGLRVERSSAAYASTDGRGTLWIGTEATLDADDSLAQMIFHELCHSLIEGPDSFAMPDWGLDNTSGRHEVREQACLRLQAALAAEHGLRRLLAPTTDFRSFYDQLGPEPLQPRHAASVTLALLGLGRVETRPWSPHLRQALDATAVIAGQAARFTEQPKARPGGQAAAPGDDLPALWAHLDPPPPPHPTGLPGAGSARLQQSCGTCGWRYQGGPGPLVSRCRQSEGARVVAEWPGCARWEPALDCQECGACCRSAYDSVTLSRREPLIRRHPRLVVDRGSYLELARIPEPIAACGGTRCAALAGGRYDGDSGELERYRCVVYDARPRTCREFTRGSRNCLQARRRVGLSR